MNQIYNETFEKHPDYKCAMNTYNNYSSGNKVSVEKRYNASQKLFDMGDDLRAIYNDPKVDGKIYKIAEELAPSQKEWKNRKK